MPAPSRFFHAPLFGALEVAVMVLAWLVMAAAVGVLILAWIMHPLSALLLAVLVAGLVWVLGRGAPAGAVGERLRRLGRPR